MKRVYGSGSQTQPTHTFVRKDADERQKRYIRRIYRTSKQSLRVPGYEVVSNDLSNKTSEVIILEAIERWRVIIKTSKVNKNPDQCMQRYACG